jgi:hypothetical protein
MKKIPVIFVFVFAIVNHALSQVTDGEAALRKSAADSLNGWKKGGTVFLNFSQTSLTNWAAGGMNSLGLNSLASVFANYKKGNATWDNSLDIGYGMLKQGDADLIKTDDKIDLLSKYGQKAFSSWYYAAMLNFKTQMADGYNYPNDSVIISKFLAPAYILAAIGIDYKPGNVFTAFVAPLTLKYTVVNDQALADSGAFGVDRGKKSRGEFGGYIRVAFKKDLMKNVNFDTKIDLFSNYLHNPQNIDINWEALLTLQANKFLAASIATQLIYDDDIIIDGGPRIQFKEILAVGVTLKF